MPTLVGVVEKPQFDIDIFKTGKAIHIKKFSPNGYELKDKDGLIGKVNPLKIMVWIYDKHENDCGPVEITIDSVISGEYEITLLKEELL
jgi:hypothetical protein